MKLNKYILASAVAGSLLTTACSEGYEKDEPRGITDKVITYDSASGSRLSYIFDGMVQSAIHCEFSEGESFSVWANYTVGDETYPYIENQTVTNKGGKFVSDQNHFWPALGKLDFFAISPFPSDAYESVDVKLTNGEGFGAKPIVDVEIMNLNNPVDLVAAKSLGLTYNGQNQAVKFGFKHLFSLVTFNITNECKVVGIPVEAYIKSLEFSTEYDSKARLDWDTMSLMPQNVKKNLSETLSDITLGREGGLDEYPHQKRVGMFFFIPQKISQIHVDATWTIVLNGAHGYDINFSKDIEVDREMFSGRFTAFNIVLKIKDQEGLTQEGDITIS